MTILFLIPFTIDLVIPIRSEEHTSELQSPVYTSYAVFFLNNKTKFSNKYKKDEVLKINIAHNEGNFFTNDNHLNQLNKENLIAFKYCDEKGTTNDFSNPNGSMENIAGIYNAKKNILGMMPHPERMVDKLISNTDG